MLAFFKRNRIYRNNRYTFLCSSLRKYKVIEVLKIKKFQKFFGRVKEILKIKNNPNQLNFDRK